MERAAFALVAAFFEPLLATPLAGMIILNGNARKSKITLLYYDRATKNGLTYLPLQNDLLESDWLLEKQVRVMDYRYDFSPILTTIFNKCIDDRNTVVHFS